MLWTENRDSHYIVRDTNFNANVCLSKTQLNILTTIADSIFSTFASIDEMASLTVYPFTIVPYEETGKISYLNTSKGPLPVVANLITPYCRYMSFGEYNVQPQYNNFADYKGYTHIKLFLPFVGYQDVDVNECMGKWLQFRLFVDFYTGKGIFIVGVSDNSMNVPLYPSYLDDDGMRVLSTFECNVGIEIPIGRSNLGDIKRNFLLGGLKTIASIGANVATAGAASAVTTTASTTTYDVSSRGVAKGTRLKKTKVGTETTETVTTHHKPVDKTKPVSDVIDSSLDALNKVYGNAHSDRVNDCGLMWDMTTNVMVIIYRPKFAELPTDYGALYGYPLGQVKTLSELTGYTEINSIHIEGDGFEKALNKEIAMLEEIFANGIIL